MIFIGFFHKSSCHNTIIMTAIAGKIYWQWLGASYSANDFIELRFPFFHLCMCVWCIYMWESMHVHVCECECTNDSLACWSSIPHLAFTGRSKHRIPHLHSKHRASFQYASHIMFGNLIMTTSKRLRALLPFYRHWRGSKVNGFLLFYIKGPQLLKEPSDLFCLSTKHKL